MPDPTFDPRSRRRRAAARLLAVPAALLALGLFGWWRTIAMPGRSHHGPLPPLTAPEQTLSAELRRDVTELSVTLGERNTRRPGALAAAGALVERELSAAGHEVRVSSFEAAGVTCRNYFSEIAGSTRRDEIVVVGAHYDSAPGAPGANDNGSGVAAVLALARRLSGSRPARTVRFELYANEEPPWFQREGMGSLVAARAARERGDRVVAMLSIETIGFYSDSEGSQRYPTPFDLFYPSTGDFVAFVGDTASRDLVRRVVGSFREQAAFPSEGAAAPGSLPGIGWSDHWSYWQQGYPAVMVTDTAPFRYRQYHTRADLPEQLDFDRMARVVEGLRAVIEQLAADSPAP